MAEVQNRIYKLFQGNSYYINDLAVNQMLNNFHLLGNSATTNDLGNLRVAMDDYMDNNLGDIILSNITRYAAIHTVQTAIENSYYQRKVGCTRIFPNAAKESLDGGVTYEVTHTSAIGSGCINIADTIAGAIGPEVFQEMVIFNQTIAPATSITGQINVISYSAQNAIGTASSLIKGPLEVHSCNVTNLGQVICSIPENPSIIDMQNCMLNCSVWDASSLYNGLTNLDTAPYCAFPVAGKEASTCIAYLTGEFLS